MTIRDAFVKSEIIEPMQRLFLPPRTMGEAEQLQALREYVAALHWFDQDTLREAWRMVRDSHDGRGWPSIAAFVKACRAARGAGERTREQASGPDAWMRRFQKFCEHRGLSASQRSVLLRPNLWWLFPKSEWKLDWHDSDIPKLYRREDNAPA